MKNSIKCLIAFAVVFFVAGVALFVFPVFQIPSPVPVVFASDELPDGYFVCGHGWSTNDDTGVVSDEWVKIDLPKSIELQKGDFFFLPTGEKVTFVGRDIEGNPLFEVEVFE